MHNNNSTKTIVSFFSGYGGLERGISTALGGNTRVLAYVERDAFPVANMVAKMEQGLMDSAPVFTDVLAFPYREFRGLVDIACGGVPCQPHSHAGKRQGGADERFLFDDFVDGMAEMRPGIILIENVQGLLTSKMPNGSLCIRYVLNKLENIGYCVENSKGQPLIGIFSASEVGAPHQRKRVFILAYDRRYGHIGRALQDGVQGRSVSEPTQSQRSEQPLVRGAVAGCGDGEDVAQQQQQGLQGHAGDEYRQGGEPGGTGGPASEGGLSVRKKPGELANPGFMPGCSELGKQQEELSQEFQGGYKLAWPSRPGERQYAWEPPRVVGDPEIDNRRISTTGVQNEKIGESCSNGFKDTSEFCQTQSPVGGNADGPTDGLDIAGLSGLCDIELAEICEWMVKGANRTDELRMCGNGVVPQTAERAFRVLYTELAGLTGTNESI